MKSICIFIQFLAYGDYLSCNGLVRYLLTKYNKILFYHNHEKNQEDYLKYMFKDIHNDLYFLNFEEIKNYIFYNLNYNYDILDTTNKIIHIDNDIINNISIKNYYYKQNTTQIIPNNIDNASNFYLSVGYNSNIKNTHFYFERNNVMQIDKS